MGSSYSKGPYPFFLIQKILNSLELVTVRSLIIKHEKRQKSNTTSKGFLNTSDIRYLLKLSEVETHLLLQLMDRDRRYRINCLDLWGALALAAIDNQNEKLRFCFELMDHNNDGYVPSMDLFGKLSSFINFYSCYHIVQTIFK